MNGKKITAREAAYRSLMLCERDRKYSNLEIDSSIRRFGLEGADKGLYTALVYGVIERRITLDYFIGKLSSKPVDALYQLIWMDRIPDSAAVNETVNLAKKNLPRAAAFINAVLRNFLRTVDRDFLPYPDKTNEDGYLSVRYSCAADVIAVLKRSVDNVRAVLEAFESHPDVTLRVNTLKTSRDEIMSRLASEGITAVPTAFSPYGIRLTDKSLPSTVSELISNGYVYIQDEASQLASCVAAPAPGGVLIDCCACPGGKSFSSAILMENRGRVYSFDLHKNKLSLVNSGAKRLAIDIIETAEKNGSVFDGALEEAADSVLCDVPCSGLGVIAKKPEIRYKSADEIERLPKIQYSIIKNASRYVKHGGVLCYSTCTLNKAENVDVVERFISENPEYAMEEFAFGELSSNNGMLTLLPHIHGTDGFFIAKFRRR